MFRVSGSREASGRLTKCSRIQSRVPRVFTVPYTSSVTKRRSRSLKPASGNISFRTRLLYAPSFRIRLIILIAVIRAFGGCFLVVVWRGALGGFFFSMLVLVRHET